MKTCAKCLRDLPLEEYSRHLRSPDGKQSWCRACQAAYGQAKRQERAARVNVEPPATKRCPRCAEVKGAALFHRHRSTPDGLQPYCAQCSTEVRRDWAERNAEAVTLRKAEKLARPAPAGTKRCTKCSEEKPYSAFYAHGGTRDGRTTYCIECQKEQSRAYRAANRERVKAWNAAGYERDKEKRPALIRERHLARHYGITSEQYEAMLAEQGGVCAICGQPEWFVDPRKGTPRRLAVDHDHVTGKVRGLLCGRCNRSIGHFEDDPEVIARAAAYLQKALQA